MLTWLDLFDECGFPPCGIARGVARGRHTTSRSEVARTAGVPFHYIVILLFQLHHQAEIADTNVTGRIAGKSKNRDSESE